MNLSGVSEGPRETKGSRKSSRRRRKSTLAEKEQDRQKSLQNHPERYALEIGEVQQKLDANWDEMQATIEKIKEYEKELDMGSFESRDEFWKLLQAEKRSAKLEGSTKKWAGHMRHRDSLGMQRAKLLSRLEQVQGREARKKGNLPKAGAGRGQGRGQRDVKIRKLDPWSPLFSHGEVRGSETSAQPSSAGSKRFLSETFSGGLSSEPCREEKGGYAGMGEKSDVKEEGVGQGEGRGGEALAASGVGGNGAGGSEDNDDGDDDSDSSVEFILSPPAISQRFFGNSGIGQGGSEDVRLARG